MYSKLLDENLLEKCYRKLKTGARLIGDGTGRRGTPGIDGVTISDFGTDLDEYIGHIIEELSSGSFGFQPVKRCWIPKKIKFVQGSDGLVKVIVPDKRRPIGIPIVRDRVVYLAMKDVLSEIIEPRLAASCFAYRRGMSQWKAPEYAAECIRAGRKYLYKTDICSYFEEIDHDRLLNHLHALIEDRDILLLIKQALKVPIAGGKGGCNWHAKKKGLHQGSPLSPLLANIYLASFDRRCENREYYISRYSDDLLVMAGSRDGARKAKRFIISQMDAFGLKVDEANIVKAGGLSFLGVLMKKDGSFGIPQEKLEQIKFRIRWMVQNGLEKSKLDEYVRGLQYYSPCGESYRSLIEYADIFKRDIHQ